MAKTSAADLAHTFKGAKFPIEKEDLLDLARKNKAPDEIMEVLEAMPDEEFQSVTEVEHAFGQMNKKEEDGRGSQAEGSGTSKATAAAQKGGQHSHGGRSKQ